MSHGNDHGHDHDASMGNTEVREEVWKREHGDTAGQEQGVIATQHAHQTEAFTI